MTADHNGKGCDIPGVCDESGSWLLERHTFIKMSFFGFQRLGCGGVDDGVYSSDGRKRFSIHVIHPEDWEYISDVGGI